jgi:hypothetical protein
MLSTVSGGTFTGAAYALALARGQDYPTFFGRFYDFLRHGGAFAAAVRQLAKSPARNLVTAAAQSYADSLFADRFSVLLDADTHLKEIVFNATEFAGGLSFRFQKSQNPKALFGNQTYSVPRDVARQVRLADVVAASSCFPGGFEPIGFPGDFNWPGDGKPPAGLPEQFGTPLPLMDGGVFDNQGIDSLLLAGERTGASLDLLIISDTNQPQEYLFRFPPSRRGRWLTLRGGVWLVRALFAASCMSAVALAWETGRSWFEHGARPLGDLCLRLLPLLFSLGVVVSLLWLRSLVRSQLLPRLPDVGVNIWQSLRGLAVAHALDLAEVRVRSLYSLTANVFLRRVRSLVYEKVFTRPSYQGKVVSNLVYGLGTNTRREKTSEWLSPSEPVKAVADRATAVPTALWFEDDAQLPDLVAGGQCTMCYSLLKHVVRTHGEDSAKYPGAVKQVFDRAKDLWDRLQKHPGDLLEEWQKGRPSQEAGQA